MIDFGVVNLVGSAIRLSWNIYEKGFSKEKSSPRRYIEFGDALFRLHSNLTTIESIVKAANTSLENDRIRAFGPSDYDTTSLTEIIGNFRLTLEECHDWLNDNKKFRQRDGVITNILYNINSDPYVVHLTERIAFHNTKISLVLDPFNIYVQTQLRDLHKEQHQDVAELLQELKQLLLSSRDPAVYTPILPAPREIQIPKELRERFEHEWQTRTQKWLVEKDEISSGPQFLVKDGLELFFNHFNGVADSADSMSYLRLMKSIWIMDQIRASDDWSKLQRTNPGGLYDRCVREMDRRLRAECSRLAATKVAYSSLSVLLELPEDALTLWPKTTPKIDASHPTHLGVLLEVPVMPDFKSHTFRTVRNIDGTFGVEDTTMTTTESSGSISNERVVQKLNFNPEKAYLVPIYEMPTLLGAPSPSCMIKLQSSQDGVNGITPEFKSIKDLLKMQHLMTGYRCVKQRKTIKVTTLAKGQDYPTVPVNFGLRSWKKTSTLIEDGNLQLWQKAPYERNQGKLDENSEPQKFPSGVSSPYPSSTTKSFSSASIISTMSSAHTQQISLGSSSSGIELTQPEPPLLVLFLKHPDTSQLSFLTIELDENTKVEPNSCDCRSSRKACAVSVLERSGTPLVARRYYARNGLNSWNLAAIGEYWSSANSEFVRVQDMYWLRLAFKTELERVNFNSNVVDLVRIFAARTNDYRKDLNLVRGTDIISQAV